MDVDAGPSVDERLSRRLAALGPASRAELLRVLNLPDTQPATLIGALYPRPEFRSLTNFLIELQQDLPALAAVVAELRLLEREDYRRSRARQLSEAELDPPEVRLVPDHASPT